MKRRGYSVFRAVDLMVRYILGELSASEKEEYFQLLKDTGLNPDRWSSRDWQEGLRDDDRFDGKEAYSRFLQNVRPPARRHSLRWVKIAALWLLAFGAGGIGWHLWKASAVEQEAVAVIRPVSAKAYIELADGTSMELTGLRDSLAERDGALIRQDSGCLVYLGKKDVPGKPFYHILNVPRGGEYTLCLTDGTKVWLNSDSRLRYPVRFDGHKREVFLSGEAYFEVAPDAASPFTVHTSLGKVNVLGTSFNVRDYKDEGRVVTTLVSGKVHYWAGRGRDCLLSPGYQVTDAGEKKSLQLREVNLEEYTGWRTGLYTFYNKTLEEIMHTVERNYDVEVSFSGEELKALRFTGDLEKYDKVEKFLRFVEMGGDVTFVVEGRKIRVEPK